MDNKLKEGFLIGKEMEKPSDSRFGSGPTKKIAGACENFDSFLMGISRFNESAKEKIRNVIELIFEVLEIPETHKIVFVPGGATGAVEWAIWNLLGANEIDVFSSGVFGDLWVYDINNELKIPSTNIFKKEIGEIDDLHLAKSKNDLLFVWNESSSGAEHNYDCLKEKKSGIVICDATSAVFCKNIPWEKIDVTAFSFQKGIGGEAGLGVLALSPKALNRFENFIPKHPIPRLLRTNNIRNEIVSGNIFSRKIDSNFLNGLTINTTPMFIIEDILFSLKWAKKNGGIKNLEQISNANSAVLYNSINKNEFTKLLCTDESRLSNSTCCFILMDHHGKPFSWEEYKLITNILEKENVAKDILNHPRSIPSLRIWTGPVILMDDIIKLINWIEFLYKKIF